MTVIEQEKWRDRVAANLLAKNSDPGRGWFLNMGDPIWMGLMNVVNYFIGAAQHVEVIAVLVIILGTIAIHYVINGPNKKCFEDNNYFNIKKILIKKL